MINDNVTPLTSTYIQVLTTLPIQDALIYVAIPWEYSLAARGSTLNVIYGPGL